MAVPRDGRIMTDEFRQGCIDSSYIQLAPMSGGLVETDHRVDRAINAAPFQYLNAEIRPQDPFDFARRARVRAGVGQPITPYSRYLPRRDVVDRPLTDHGMRPVLPYPGTGNGR
jgi:hypothetical protein